MKKIVEKNEITIGFDDNHDDGEGADKDDYGYAVKDDIMNTRTNKRRRNSSIDENNNIHANSNKLEIEDGNDNNNNNCDDHDNQGIKLETNTTYTLSSMIELDMISRNHSIAATWCRSQSS